MKVNLEQRKKRLNPKFFTVSKEKESADFFDEYSVSHFLNRGGADFISLDYIQEYSKSLHDRKEVKDKNRLLTLFKNSMMGVDARLSKLSIKDLTPKDLIPYFKILSHHTHYSMGLERISRYGSNPLRVGNIWDKINQSLKDINLINEYKSDPETGGIELDSWNDIMSSSWACIAAGWDDIAYYLLNSLEELIYKHQSNPPKNPVFRNVLGQPDVHSRFLMSVYKGLGKVGELRGDLDMAKNYYQKIVDFFPENKEKKGKVFWYTGKNRVIESNIQLYLLEPTEKRKNEILTQFIETRSDTQSIDAYETVTESCLVAFMVYKHVLKGDTDKIKF